MKALSASRKPLGLTLSSELLSYCCLTILQLYLVSSQVGAISSNARPAGASLGLATTQTQNPASSQIPTAPLPAQTIPSQPISAATSGQVGQPQQQQTTNAAALPAQLSARLEAAGAQQVPTSAPLGGQQPSGNMEQGKPK